MTHAADPAPNFFILGAPKCGTTSLHQYFGQHPDVFMSEPKEPHFFDEDEQYEKGMGHYLGACFSGAESFKVRGESTPAYLRRHATVIPRIKRSLDAETLRFVVILRDPVERAWSHYLHTRRQGQESEPFERALRLEEERNARDARGWYGYFSDGLYARQISAWLEEFPRQSFLLLLTEDLNRDESSVLREVCAFAGVDPAFDFETQERHNRAASPRSVALTRLLSTPNPLKSALRSLTPPSGRKLLNRALHGMNRGGTPPRLDPTLARDLRARYAPEVAALEKILGRDLSGWQPSPR